jgi:hypothetical protein
MLFGLTSLCFAREDLDRDVLSLLKPARMMPLTTWETKPTAQLAQLAQHAVKAGRKRGMRRRQQIYKRLYSPR